MNLTLFQTIALTALTKAPLSVPVDNKNIKYSIYDTSHLHNLLISSKPGQTVATNIIKIKIIKPR